MKEIPLSNGGIAFVDDEDFEKISLIPWYGVDGGYTRYAYTMTSRQSSKRTTIAMHQLILEITKGEVDHINRNGLDNRKSNLRIATRNQQMMNAIKRKNKTTSQYKGVCWTNKRWQANINVNGRQLYLGRFKVEEDAARAYDDAARRYFGEFARTNF
jgi:osmotically-inducible protein OsmY